MSCLEPGTPCGTLSVSGFNDELHHRGEPNSMMLRASKFPLHCSCEPRWCWQSRAKGSPWTRSACDAKVLDEDEETGIKKYRYIRTGTNHFSLAFTYDCIAWSRDRRVGPAVLGPGG